MLGMQSTISSWLKGIIFLYIYHRRQLARIGREVCSLEEIWLVSSTIVIQWINWRRRWAWWFTVRIRVRRLFVESIVSWRWGNEHTQRSSKVDTNYRCTRWGHTRSCMKTLKKLNISIIIFLLKKFLYHVTYISKHSFWHFTKALGHLTNTDCMFHYRNGSTITIKKLRFDAGWVIRRAMSDK